MLSVDVILWNGDNTGCNDYTPLDYCLHLFKGPTIVRTPNAVFVTEPYSLVLFNIGTTHSYYPADPNGNEKHDLVHFSGPEVAELLEALELPLDTVFQTYQSEYVSNLIKHLHRETIREYSKRRIALDTLLRYLLFQISKEMYGIGTETPSMFDPYARAVRDIRKDIVAHPERDWSIQEMADSLNISYSHFCKLYKKFHLISPNRDLINIRIQRAQYLLNCCSMSVREVAEAVGYKSEYYFIRLFKEHVGESPGAFIKSHRGGDVGT